ncbi:NAD(P)/FAD-dependent oxidoreductase [Desulfobacula toluolica]|uniref:Geranylgeranyl reductase n=1 Tax=Desulfobacula toluolica (strain DSM 7467 / Tol2) TaxID=651182 RepID=K0NQ63_DESTT|nr:geranylgeranyl reductase family protein [Desulfobacula toluolica]CCK81012.1 geranylgeranyl reductase [Desulfobacula toluolica Tol2]
MFDVAIIGAGPAGTAAAFDLLLKGLKVLILDKYEFPRKKACAGGITPKGYHLFRYDISSMVKRECSTVKISPHNKKSFFIKDDNTLCYMTKREDLDLFSLNKVMEKGADFRVIKKIQSINETPVFVEIHTDSEYLRASYLIGADGANSIVRRFVSKGRFYQKQFAIEADVKIDRPDMYHMEFDFSKSLNGYYWIFPKDDHVNIGNYSVDSNSRLQIQHLFDYADEKLHSRRLDAVKGYPICTGGFKYRPDSKRVLLAGDAAGLSERLLGEGIFFAVKSGQAAARAILESELHALSARDLYREKLKAIQADLRVYDLSSNWFYTFPGVSLKAVSFPFVHKRFSKGYADGKTITQILCGKAAAIKNR